MLHSIRSGLGLNFTLKKLNHEQDKTDFFMHTRSPFSLGGMVGVEGELLSFFT